MEIKTRQRKKLRIQIKRNLCRRHAINKNRSSLKNIYTGQQCLFFHFFQSDLEGNIINFTCFRAVYDTDWQSNQKITLTREYYTAVYYIVGYQISDLISLEIMIVDRGCLPLTWQTVWSMDCVYSGSPNLQLEIRIEICPFHLPEFARWAWNQTEWHASNLAMERWKEVNFRSQISVHKFRSKIVDS